MVSAYNLTVVTIMMFNMTLEVESPGNLLKVVITLVKENFVADQLIRTLSLHKGGTNVIELFKWPILYCFNIFQLLSKIQDEDRITYKQAYKTLFVWSFTPNSTSFFVISRQLVHQTGFPGITNFLPK